MAPRFAGKVALVTGATTGIGQSTSVRLAAEGALVGINQKPAGDPTETLRLVGVNVATGCSGNPVNFGFMVTVAFGSILTASSDIAQPAQPR